MAQTKAEQISTILKSAGVLPEELQVAPPAVPIDRKSLILLGKSNGKDDPLINGHSPEDVCSLGKNRRDSFEVRFSRELAEGVQVDPMEAFEEALTYQEDLEN